MKTIKTLFVLCCIYIPILSHAQAENRQDEVTLTVSSDGATKGDAVKAALRSAIEQAYGTFVSANTSILNDSLVQDEIVTVASGNIKGYSEYIKQPHAKRQDIRHSENHREHITTCQLCPKQGCRDGICGSYIWHEHQNEGIRQGKRGEGIEEHDSPTASNTVVLRLQVGP